MVVWHTFTVNTFLVSELSKNFGGSDKSITRFTYANVQDELLNLELSHDVSLLRGLNYGRGCFRLRRVSLNETALSYHSLGSRDKSYRGRGSEPGVGKNRPILDPKKSRKKSKMADLCSHSVPGLEGAYYWRDWLPQEVADLLADKVGMFLACHDGMEDKQARKTARVATLPPWSFDRRLRK